MLRQTRAREVQNLSTTTDPPVSGGGLGVKGAGPLVILGGLASAGAMGTPLCSLPCSKSPTDSPCEPVTAAYCCIVHVLPA